ncbi:MAG: RNA polymerase sigma factor [Gammaproteobacteria bacterium]
MDRRCLIAEWLRQNGQMLRAFLTRRTGCPETAADLAQETALRLHLRSQQQEIGHPRALAFRIATQLAIDHARKHTVRERYEDRAADPLAVPSPAPGPDQQLAHRQRLEDLARALTELPLACRTALMLCAVEGLTYAEVAERLGISKRMVAKHLARALAHCKARAGE